MGGESETSLPVDLEQLRRRRLEALGLRERSLESPSTGNASQTSNSATAEVVDLLDSNDSDDDKQNKREKSAVRKRPPVKPSDLGRKELPAAFAISTSEGVSSNENDRKLPAAKMSSTADAPTDDGQEPATMQVHNPYRKLQPRSNASQEGNATTGRGKIQAKRRRGRTQTRAPPHAKQPLQAGIVLQEDVNDTSMNPSSSDEDNMPIVTIESYSQEQEERIARGERPILFSDQEFETVPASIEGTNKKAVVSCRCRGSQPAKLSYKTRQGNSQQQHPYYHCARNKCNFFQWAFQAEKMQWYRFGKHTGHCIVTDAGFSANDLCQGRVGDCWFLSALAVVAERPDLILRLFGDGKFTELNEYGVVQVNLFLDGFWKTVVVDSFLPCMIDDASESELQQALEASLEGFGGAGRMLKNGATVGDTDLSTSSNFDPYAISDKCLQVLQDTHEFLQQHQARSTGSVVCRKTPRSLQRLVTWQDLAYSKAHRNQLWVPFLEKAYSKSHGCYRAISGGQICEAFLDLTGAPTLVYNFDSKDFQPRSFWAKLLQYRRQRLPMGCGTSSSAVGIIGMHAYSILDVREVKNVSYRFFQETGVAHGNVSGFTECDGTVRLLRIRNPHAKGEWKGEFSDKSDIWEKLLQHQEPGGDAAYLHRTMKNDGIFWIDYDSFLMGFHNVDVVLAFLGNHAKSFPSNFPAKKSDHRCARAFEVSLLDEQPGGPNRDAVELYIMGIQKNRRGASHGREDRKKSYKVCDLGVLVGGNHHVDAFNDDEGNSSDMSFTTVKGQMFGFTRNGHFRLILDRKKNKSLVVMPVSFGHPAATDKELSFVLRFVADAPLLIRELPSVPRMDLVFQTFCLTHRAPYTNQGKQRILVEVPMYRLVQVDCLGNGGGTVFLYLCINQDELRKQGNAKNGVSFSVETHCRGMSCRVSTENGGLLKHETVAKGKKFEAAWRRYTSEFIGERKSRLLLVLFQSGIDTEFGSISCKRITTPRKLGTSPNGTLYDFPHVHPEHSTRGQYSDRGIFNPVDGNEAFVLSGSLATNFGASQQTGGYQEGFDEELERALALSRGDLELQKAIELSKRETSGRDEAAKFDPDLQRALELSKMDTSSSTVVHAASIGGISDIPIDQDLERAIEESKKPAYEEPTASYEEDLRRAILLSQKDIQQINPVKKDEIVDLTEDGVAPAKRRKMDGSTSLPTKERHD